MKKRTLRLVSCILAICLLAVVVVGCAKNSTAAPSATATPSSSAPAASAPAASAPAASAPAATSSGASNYPNKSISFIIPYSTGGTTDTIGRLICQYLGDALGVQMIPVNKPGSSGEIGAMEIVNAKPDGYTLGTLCGPDFFISDIMNDKFDFDFDKSVRYAASFNKTAISYYSTKDARYDTWDKFVEYSKAHPGELTVGESGITHRLMAAAIMDKFGIQYTTINFNGSGDSLTALLGGHVNALSNGNQMLSNVVSGGCVPLLWDGKEKPKDFPNTALFSDYGLQFDCLAVVNYLVMPKGVPDDIANIIAEGCKKINENSEFYGKILALDRGFDPSSGEKDTLAKCTQYYNDIKAICDKHPELVMANG